VKFTEPLHAAFAILAIGFSLGVGAPEASAQAGQSETFFAEGRKLRQAGKCHEALIVFKRSLELDPSRIGSLRNIAECEVQLRRYASARRSYWDLRRAALQSSDPRYQGWEKDAEAAYDALTSKVPRLTIKLTGAGDTRQRTKVTIDGLPLDPRMIDVELEQDEGSHIVEADYGAVAPVVEKLSLNEGERRTLTLTIPDRPSAPPPTGSSVAPPPPPPGRGPLFVAGVSGLAVGGAALIGLGIAAGVREGAVSEVSGECPTLKGCDPALGSAVDRGRAAATMVNVFLGVAGVAIAGGAGLLIADRARGPSPKQAVSWRLTASPLPGAPGLSLDGRF
jgi:hypothetical protein